ncbi:polysaccharide biosynthesis protein [Candidatus Methylopumilus universalis]|uniref:Polysaccharide biosynthesis protein n=1 Tax=Candidatus Methylopumilus universalis TaxID=2588536 RepID=A0ABX5VUH5_9PROT|nr:nucleoside-diphosphate sugar epimerase/dehydratase [Candidatus Methylopumilus universalis]QDC51229.1 polysaccharide biosynthesis protein [Candidatus Methylopumilus universalis]QDC61367.1 polysaccharide biosynthesis protein [Candidatus Methylopumilus universalis]
MKKTLINFRSILALSHDAIAAALAWYLAFLLRFNFEVPSDYLPLMNQTALIVLPLQTFAFLSFGLYRGTWRFASVPDLKRILIAVAMSSIFLLSLLFMMNSSTSVPRSVLIIDPVLLVLMMGGSRFVYRSIKEHQLYAVYLRKGEPVIVFGAGAAAISLVKDLSQSGDWQVVAILDDDETMHGREIIGVKIFGNIASLPKVVNRFSARHAIIAMPSAKHQERRKALELANELRLEVLTVPAIDDLISGRLNVSQIRPVDVEDLLGRDAVDLDNSGLKNLISGQRVLVSGAGGSIGSELCRQIVKFKPSHLICLDISEYALYQLEQELNTKDLSTKLVYAVGDVKNTRRLDKLLGCHRPKIIFHAAAYKHVPLMEIENVSEAFNNNVLGTYLLAQACKKSKVEKFVLVSTDKAVNPANVMGATKRLAEMVCQGLQDIKGTRFVIVRFGNVLGSSGSVIPKFRQQIKAGGPITVTHPEITRYFMSIPEAAQLVMQAGLMGEGGEIFVLDMGEPVRIVELAKDMIKLSGFKEDEIAIEFTGLRPGEKLYEELLADDEHTLPTPHEKLRIASARVVDEAWVDSLLAWIATTLDKDETLIKQELKNWVGEYSPDLPKH